VYSKKNACTILHTSLRTPFRVSNHERVLPVSIDNFGTQPVTTVKATGYATPLPVLITNEQAN
jgi:hypothetical protein